MDSAAARAKPARRHRPAVFFLSFVAIFFILQQAYFHWREHTGNAWSARLNASVAARIVNLLDASAEARALHTEIVSSRARVEIMKGCEGSDVVLLAMAALLAFPLPWRRKLAGLALAALMIYAVNLIRIVSLYFALAYRPQWFNLLHGVIWQTLIILLVAVFFLFWTQDANPSHERSR